MSGSATFDAKLERSAGFCQHDYLPMEADIPQRAIYSALPGIVLSSTVVTSEQGPVIAMDGTRNTTVYADLVYVVGKIIARGVNIKIVARKIVFVGDSAAVVTDGVPGAQPTSLAAEPTPGRAKDGQNAILTDPYSLQPSRSAENGTPGRTGAEVHDGAPGGKGTLAGDIEIDVEKWVGTS